LIWIKENYPDTDFATSKIYEEYQEEEEYEGKESTFYNLINKLCSKNLLERPEHGKYRINTRGKRKAEYLIGGEEIDAENEDLEEIRLQLLDFLDERKEEIKQSIADSTAFKLKLSELDKFNPELIDYFENNPEKFLDAVDKAFNTVLDVSSRIDYTIDCDVDYWEIPLYKARSNEYRKKLITVQGTVESASDFHQELVSAVFECSQCGERYEKEQDSAKLKSPYKCECGSKKFGEVSRNLINLVSFRISNEKGHNEYIKADFRSSSITSDIQEAFKPGQELRVTGVAHGQPIGKDSSKVEPILKVVSFKPQDSQKVLEDYKKEEISLLMGKVDTLENPFQSFATSIAPSIVEQEFAKKVVAASLIGGKATGGQGGSGRIHSLLLSNPGSGKSDIQNFVKETFSNVELADGSNATGPALTATVEQEEGNYRLRAGKLVYADEGVLCLDEFDKMNKNDSSRLNTAMTSKTFPIDKASINAELPGNATVVATGNFEDYVDDMEFVKDSIPDHAESLLDRFHLIYAMRSPDNQEKVQDAIFDSFNNSSQEKASTDFDEEELVLYRELAASKDPELTDESVELLKKWLRGQKEIADSKGNSSFKTDSNRHLMALGLLTTMFAKSRLSSKTNEEDAERAVKLFMRCRNSLGLYDGDTDQRSQKVKA